MTTSNVRDFINSKKLTAETLSLYKEVMLAFFKPTLEIENGKVLIPTGQHFDFPIQPGEISESITELDVSDYLTIIETPEFQALGKRSHLGFLVNSEFNPYTRMLHSFMALHWARQIGQNASLKNNEQRTVELYSLLHDIGHVSFSHPGETYLNRLNRHFSHEENGLRIISELKERGILAAEDFSSLEGMFTGKNSLAPIVSGELGADRLAYVNYDIAKLWGHIDSSSSVKLARLQNIAENAVFESGIYSVRDDAREDAALLLFARSLQYLGYYLSPHLKTVEEKVQRYMHELGWADFEKLLTVSEQELERSLLDKFGVGIEALCQQMYYAQDFGSEAGYSLVLQIVNGDYGNKEYLYSPDIPLNLNIKHFLSASMREKVDADEGNSIIRKLTPLQAVIELEHGLSAEIGLGKGDLMLLTTLQKIPYPKPVPIYCGGEVRDLMELMPELKALLTQIGNDIPSVTVSVEASQREKAIYYFRRNPLAEAIRNL